MSNRFVEDIEKAKAIAKKADKFSKISFALALLSFIFSIVSLVL